MGYNISDISGNGTGSGTLNVDQWTFTPDLTDPSVTSISGDFNVSSVFDDSDQGEATDGYVFSALSTSEFGTLSYDETTGEFTFTINRAALMASGSDQVISFTITGTSGANSDTDTIFINLLICVLRGTLIETGRGPVPVEALHPGDMIRTKDNGLQPVQWIGSRKLGTAELVADPTLCPVWFSAGSLGGGLPTRDLGVSPQHRMLIADWRAELMFGENEVLVPAKALVNGTSVQVDESAAPVEYFHLLFEQHEVMFTEGAATESFHPGSYALRELGDAARVELRKLFPDLFETDSYGDTARLSLRPWEGRVCLANADAMSDQRMAG